MSTFQQQSQSQTQAKINNGIKTNKSVAKASLAKAAGIGSQLFQGVKDMVSSGKPKETAPGVSVGGGKRRRKSRRKKRRTKRRRKSRRKRRR